MIFANQEERNSALALGVFLVILSGLRLFLAGRLELSPDEAYYLAWSRQPAWGYFDHPPLLAWLIHLSAGLLGESELAVRLPAILLGAATSWLLFQNALTLSASPRQALWIAVLGSATPILSVGSLISTPETALAFGWSWTLFFALRLRADRRSAWVGLGLALGLCVLSKNTGFLAVLGLLLYAAASRTGREALLSPHSVLAGAVALGLLVPHLAWNAMHRGGSLTFQAHHAFADASFAPLHFVQFIGGQLGVLGPVAAVALALFLATGFSRRVATTRPQIFLCWCLAAPLVLLCAGLSLFHKVEANWPAAAWTAALPAVPWMISGGRWFVRRRGLWTALAVGIAGLFSVLIHLQALMPFLPISPDRDATARLRGWWELAREAADDADALGAALAAEGYATTSALSYYTGHSVRYLPAPGRRSQYDLWDEELPPRSRPPRLLVLQPASDTLRPPAVCQGAAERFLLLKDGPEAPWRARQYRFWACLGIPPQGEPP
ncbi:MAG: glycosyltransferase family 39 protein [Myxococcales bacterium]|nr:glycosyltransferase family 39 protein [Myxococcales bacterium]